MVLTGYKNVFIRGADILDGALRKVSEVLAGGIFHDVCVGAVVESDEDIQEN